MHQRILILLLASASCLFGQGLSLKNPGFVASLDKANVAAAGCSYLKCEEFEDATYGYDSHNVNGWTTNTGTAINPKDTGLVGAQSLSVALSADNGVYVPFTASGEIYVFFAFKPTGTYGGLANVFRFLDGSGTQLVGVQGTSAAANSFNSTLAGTFSTGYTNNTLCYIWMRYKKGTGADGIFQFWTSLTTTKPGSPSMDVSVATYTSDVARLGLGYDSGDGDLKLFMDTVRISTTSLGSNP